MLDNDELDARVGQAFASRTYAELAALTADIPARSAAAEPVPASAGRPDAGESGPEVRGMRAHHVRPGGGCGLD